MFESNAVSKCYLIVEINPKTLVVEDAYVRSEPPWYITRAFPGSSYYRIMAVVHETTAGDYDTARLRMLESYEHVAPELAAKFSIVDLMHG